MQSQGESFAEANERLCSPDPAHKKYIK
jgi:hypothetical protein